MKAASVPTEPAAAWEANGKVQTVAGAEAVARAPRNAVRYEIRTYRFPDAATCPGSFQVLTFKAANGGVLHPITNESSLYVLKGAAEVGIKGEPTTLGEGDAANRPDGALRNGGAPRDAILIAYSIGSVVSNPTSMVVRRSDAPIDRMAMFVRNGKLEVVRGDDVRNLPANAGIATHQAYTFDTRKDEELAVSQSDGRRAQPLSDEIRHAFFLGGGSLATPEHPARGLNRTVFNYLAAGRARYTGGDESIEMTPGDGQCVPANAPHYWDVLEDTDIIAINVPTRAD